MIVECDCLIELLNVPLYNLELGFEGCELCIDSGHHGGEDKWRFAWKTSLAGEGWCESV